MVKRLAPVDASQGVAADRVQELGCVRQSLVDALIANTAIKRSKSLWRAVREEVSYIGGP